jgi:hypothetical protein
MKLKDWQRYYQTSPPLSKLLLVAGSFLALVMVFHLVALAVTGGTMYGPVSLRKPATFAETGWLMCWAVAYFLPLLNLRRGGRVFITVGVLVFALGETLIASIQAWRGQPFHYNESSLTNSLLLYSGAVGSVVFFVSLLVLLFSLWRRQTLSPSLLLSLRAGTLLTVFGALMGYFMTMNSSGVWLGTERWQANGVFDLYTKIDELLAVQERVGGNLVVLHALGVHGFSLFPLAAWLLTFSSLAEKQRVRLITYLVVALTVVLVLLTVQAFSIKPLTQLDALTAALLTLGAFAFMGVYAFIFLEVWQTRQRQRRMKGLY